MPPPPAAQPVNDHFFSHLWISQTSEVPMISHTRVLSLTGTFSKAGSSRAWDLGQVCHSHISDFILVGKVSFHDLHRFWLELLLQSQV